MDTITTIIVTVLANAIVTGIIVYLIQKKIESSFVKKMEEFRANLQKSSAEHQIKFSRNYPKTLEVLEAYHQKLYECSRFCSQLHSRLLRALREKQTLEDKELLERKHQYFRIFMDFTTYLSNNRLYLPDEILRELEKIKSRAGVLGLISASLIELANDPIEDLVEYINLCSRFIGISTNISIEGDDVPKELKEELLKKLEEAIPEENRVQMFTSQIDSEFTNLLQQSEQLYKSVAEAQ